MNKIKHCIKCRDWTLQIVEVDGDYMDLRFYFKGFVLVTASFAYRVGFDDYYMISEQHPKGVSYYWLKITSAKHLIFAINRYTTYWLPILLSEDYDNNELVFKYISNMLFNNKLSVAEVKK